MRWNLCFLTSYHAHEYKNKILNNLNKIEIQYKTKINGFGGYRDKIIPHSFVTANVPAQKIEIYVNHFLKPKTPLL